MSQDNKHQDDPDYDRLDDEITIDEINRILKNHPHDYIAKLEEIGFTYHDDDSDHEEQEEAEARPLNSNQEYLVSFFNGGNENIAAFLSRRTSVFPVVGEDVLYRIIEEYEGRELVYENFRAKEKKNKYSRFYRQMLRPVMETLLFRANNPADQPLLDGIALVRKYLDKNVHAPYDDMVRHVVAAKEQTAPVDSILRRFNRNNPATLTHKGFLEVGKALRTIHNCNFLTDPS